MTPGNEDASPYNDYSLLEGEVRLVVLKQQSDIDAPVECGLEVVRLEDGEVRFEALSYTWGPPFEDQVLPDQAILLNGIEMKVRGNLFDALRQFRLMDRPRYIWIDALSINQESSDERSHQVSVMGRIFAKASKVIVWLGQETNDHDGEVSIAFLRSVLECEEEVLRVYNNVSARSVAFQHALRKPQTTFTALVASKFPQYLCDPEDRWYGEKNRQYNFALQSLIRFFSRRYFKRRWVLQEIFHAQDAEVYCGPHKISWVTMMSATQKHYVQTPDPRFFHRSIFTLDNLDKYHQGGSAAVMFKLMDAFLEHKCEDPRDRLYALLSLQSTPCMKPNYAWSVSRLWTEFSVKCILEGLVDTLLLLAALQLRDYRKAKDPTLRSWVPDFSLNFSHMDIGIVAMKEDCDSFAIPDLDDSLYCTLPCFGEIVMKNGWAILCPFVAQGLLPEVPDNPPSSYWSQFGSSISSLKVVPGRYSSLRFDELNSFNLREDDLLCQGPQLWALILRRVPERLTADIKSYRIIDIALTAYESRDFWPKARRRQVRIV